MCDSTPICRCRVLYLGSAVPRQSKDGLQGIQEPLRSLYPSEGAFGAKGIDSWLSVWSNGILLENVDENLKQITRFFPIESLHYCAAVRQVLIPERGSKPEPKFLPLDSPFARMPRAQHPPIFAAILRRTTGIKVLECHVFICKREAAANALVRCCFHAYADNSYARQLETGSGSGSLGGGLDIGGGTLKSAAGSSKSNGDLTEIGGNDHNQHHHHHHHNQQQHYQHQHLVSGSPRQTSYRSRAGSTTTLNSVGRQQQQQQQQQFNGHTFNGGTSGSSINGGGGGGGGISNSSALEGYTSVKNFFGSSADLNVTVDDGDNSIYGDENHKVWNGSQDQIDSIAMENPYEVFSGDASTLGRPVRARQISTPIEVPPPPMREDNANNKMHHKNYKKSATAKTAGSQSLSGTLIRPKPIHPSLLQRGGGGGGGGIYAGAPMGGGGAMLYGPVVAAGGSRAFHMQQTPPRSYHTIGHRGLHYHHMSGIPTPPPSAASHHHQMILQHQLQHPHPHPHAHHPQMVGGGGGAGAHLPYMTLQKHSATSKKKNKDKKANGIPVGLPIIPPAAMHAYHHHHHHQHQHQHGMMTALPPPPPPPPPSQLDHHLTQSMLMAAMDDGRPLSRSHRKLALSMGNGLDVIPPPPPPAPSNHSGTESPGGGTGIYRRKGHLNERAFSYSIRQEHRSRSHGSLASIQFNPPDVKKEREIAQLVAGLELNDDSEREREIMELQRENAHMTNGGGGGGGGVSRHFQQHQQQVIYGNGGGSNGAQAIYGSNMSQVGGFNKPRR